MKIHLPCLAAALALVTSCASTGGEEALVPPRTRIEARVTDTIEADVLPLTGGEIDCRVAVVNENGSSATTGSGTFRLSPPSRYPAVLMATTPDGRIGWTSLTPGTRGQVAFDLDRPGAFVDLTLRRAEDTRVAIFKGADRLHDVTLRPGQTRRLVVPTGDVTVQLTYEGSAPVACDLEAGEVLGLDLE